MTIEEFLSLVRVLANSSHVRYWLHYSDSMALSVLDWNGKRPQGSYIRELKMMGFSEDANGIFVINRIEGETKNANSAGK